ncbi:hypothetical protein CTEN210_14055 [Chaetoceros tenuissimus]|uniref:Uncharacterized protein n=1 Tax=Chaetoceros tenuissimus TaxID=426638 RepID=A0AAD3D4G6_9STRA|nr:hypothetical protein CTEN210_14055 [Chaetoceros tenuissimus]
MSKFRIRFLSEPLRFAKNPFDTSPLWTGVTTRRTLPNRRLTTIMNIATFQSNLDFIKQIYFREEWKDKDCLGKIQQAVKECNEKIIIAFGESLHKLAEHKPSLEGLEKVVTKFPSTLSHINEYNSLPIHTITGPSEESICAPEYVPILAKEGLKHGVGGEHTRGGLLTDVPYNAAGWNTLECLSYDSEYDQTSRLSTLKELRKIGLLVEKDIQEQWLLYTSLYNGGHEIFEYLVKWNPNALLNTRYNLEPLIHAMVWELYLPSESVTQFVTTILTAGFKYHPHIGGLLFTEDYEGTIALDVLLDEYSVEDVMRILHSILSPAKDYPILHHILTKAPQHGEVFAIEFPWAGSLRDHNGRSLHQVLMAAGPNVMNEHWLLFAMLTDNQIQEKDPITTLYPFAAMAVGEHADLQSCFYLLRRHPSVMDERSRTSVCRRTRIRKRKASKSILFLE